jgi:hypothetical protein
MSSSPVIGAHRALQETLPSSCHQSKTAESNLMLSKYVSPHLRRSYFVRSIVRSEVERRLSTSPRTADLRSPVAGDDKVESCLTTCSS